MERAKLRTSRIRIQVVEDEDEDLPVEVLLKRTKFRTLPGLPHDKGIDLFRQAEQNRIKEGKLFSLWPRICVSPKQTPLDDIKFQIVLYLVQANVIDLTPEAEAFCVKYLKGFKGAERAGMIDRSQDGKLKLGGGFDYLRLHYVIQEDWKGFRKYLAKTIQEFIAKTASEESEESERRGIFLDPETHEEQWGVERVSRETGLSRDRIYRLIRQGDVNARHMHSGRRSYYTLTLAEVKA
ncbi:MAG: hypothetical protein HY347_01030 [candidate division NC10 bacterium]|nr:hypothetical protein [candidate division NC10 bacterium]